MVAQTNLARSCGSIGIQGTWFNEFEHIIIVKNVNTVSSMEWLKPHILRIDELCLSFKNNYERSGASQRSKSLSDVRCTCGAINCQAGPEDIDHSYLKQLANFQHLTDYRSQNQSVSVIVSDKSGNVSPASSLSDSNNQSNENETSGGDEETSTESADSSGSGVSVPTKKNKCEYHYKPIPMVRKSRRRFISPEQKDESYWERRRRNNEAAKKSREQRREKEIEVNRKCNDLEKENSGLKYSVMNLEECNTQMQTTLKMYKDMLYRNNLL